MFVPSGGGPGGLRRRGWGFKKGRFFGGDAQHSLPIHLSRYESLHMRIQATSRGVSRTRFYALLLAVQNSKAPCVFSERSMPYHPSYPCVRMFFFHASFEVLKPRSSRWFPLVISTLSDETDTPSRKFSGKIPQWKEFTENLGNVEEI